MKNCEANNSSGLAIQELASLLNFLAVILSFKVRLLYLSNVCINKLCRSTKIRRKNFLTYQNRGVHIGFGDVSNSKRVRYSGNKATTKYAEDWEWVNLVFVSSQFKTDFGRLRKSSEAFGNCQIRDVFHSGWASLPRSRF